MACLEKILEVDDVDLEPGQHSSGPPPPATAANKPPRKKKNQQKRRTTLGGGCCCRLAFFSLLAAALAAALVGALYLALDPKLPRYHVSSLNVTAFDMDSDLTARARFDASVRFENPNRRIGIRYEAGPRFSIGFFTSIGLGGIKVTENLREHLESMEQEEPSSSGSDSGSSSDSWSDSESSFD
ncbi:unnamed protein product [Urochloa humidicola]